MGELTIAKLTEEARRQREAHNAKLRARYRLARRLGFPAAESRLLSHQSVDVINKLAREKG